jgi:hypothetical protein
MTRHRLHAARYVAILAVAGCGASSPPNPPPPQLDASVTTLPVADYASGSRLRAEVYRDEDGHAVWHGWFDSQLQIECAFDVAEDGALRCLPEPNGYDVVYSDPSCATPYAIANEGQLVAPQGYVLAQAFCSSHAVYTGNATLATGHFYTLNANGSCTYVTSSGYYLFDIASHTPASTFVAATIVTQRGDDALDRRVLSAEDGAQRTLSGFDRNHDADCDTSPQYGACIPHSTAYANSTCASPLIDPQCVPPSTVTAADGCTAIARYASAETCTVNGETYAIAGAAFTPPPIASADLGTGRMRLRWATSASGTPIRVTGFYDSWLRVACHPENGVCAPDAQYVGETAALVNNCSADWPVVSAHCGVAPRYAFTGRYFAVSGPLAPGVTLCAGGEGCFCHAYDGGGSLWATSLVPDGTFAPLSDVTE